MNVQISQDFLKRAGSDILIFFFLIPGNLTGTYSYFTAKNLNAHMICQSLANGSGQQITQRMYFYDHAIIMIFN